MRNESARGGERVEQFQCDLSNITCENCGADDKTYTNMNVYANGLFGFICVECDK